MGIRGDTSILLHRKCARPAEMAAVLGIRSWRAWAYRALGAALVATQTPLSKHGSITLVDGNRHDTSRPTGNKANLFLLGVLRPGLGPQYKKDAELWIESRGGPLR